MSILKGEKLVTRDGEREHSTTINLPPYVIWHESPTPLSSEGFDCITHMSTFVVLCLLAGEWCVAVSAVGGFASLSCALSCSAQKRECFGFVSDGAVGMLVNSVGDDPLMSLSGLSSHVR